MAEQKIKFSPPIFSFRDTLARNEKVNAALRSHIQTRTKKWQERVDEAATIFTANLRRNRLVGGAAGFVGGTFPVACAYINNVVAAPHVKETMRIGTPVDVVTPMYGIAAIVSGAIVAAIGAHMGSRSAEKGYHEDVQPVERVLERSQTFLASPGFPEKASAEEFDNFVNISPSSTRIPLPR